MSDIKPTEADEALAITIWNEVIRGETNVPAIALAIAKARMDERERCAELVLSTAVNPTIQDTVFSAVARTKSRVAQAIRSQSQ